MYFSVCRGVEVSSAIAAKLCVVFQQFFSTERTEDSGFLHVAPLDDDLAIRNQESE